MKIYIGQIYGEVGVSFPFTSMMQKWMSEELSSAAMDMSKFESKYGPGFRLIINLSARSKSSMNEVRGPSVYKKTRDVEYSLFLPYDTIIGAPGGCRTAMVFMLDGIQVIFQKAGISAEKLEARRQAIIDHVCSEPTMLRAPWPTAPAVDPSSLH